MAVSNRIISNGMINTNNKYISFSFFIWLRLSCGCSSTLLFSVVFFLSSWSWKQHLCFSNPVALRLRKRKEKSVSCVCLRRRRGADPRRGGAPQRAQRLRRLPPRVHLPPDGGPGHPLEPGELVRAKMEDLFTHSGKKYCIAEHYADWETKPQLPNVSKYDFAVIKVGAIRAAQVILRLWKICPLQILNNGWNLCYK